MADHLDPSKSEIQADTNRRYLRAIALALQTLLVRTKVRDSQRATEQTRQNINNWKFESEIRGLVRSARGLLWLVTFAVTGALMVIGVFLAQTVNARRADRPYISVSNDYSSIVWRPINTRQFDGLGRAVWSWTLTNYGREVALDVRHHDRLNFNWGLRKFNNKESSDQPVPIAGNMKILESTISHEVMTKAAFDWALATDGVVQLRSKISYSDRYGRKYETDICQFNRAENIAPGSCLGSDMQ